MAEQTLLPQINRDPVKSHTREEECGSNAKDYHPVINAIAAAACKAEGAFLATYQSGKGFLEEATQIAAGQTPHSPPININNPARNK
jgi:hypothetical protein